MKHEQIVYEVRDHVALLKLNRPEVYNAFSDVMREEIREIINAINYDKNVRVLILTGEGKMFCVGGDVKLMISRMEAKVPFDERRDIFRKDVAAMVKSFYDVKVPMIAAVNGGAYGAGVSLSMLCDIRIAAASAKFGFLFGKRALAPDWGANYFLPRIVGYAKAMEWISACKTIDSATALASGLVNHVVPDDKLLESAMELASSIAANSPVAVAASKAALRLGMAQCLDDAVEHEANIQALCQVSTDHVEGVMSFVEKREPKFV